MGARGEIHVNTLIAGGFRGEKESLGLLPLIPKHERFVFECAIALEAVSITEDYIDINVCDCRGDIGHQLRV